MNHKERNEFLQTCNLLGLSPFDALGVKHGDRFTLNETGTVLIFINVSRMHNHIALFREAFDVHSINPLYYHFTLVTPNKPYEYL